MFILGQWIGASSYRNFWDSGKDFVNFKLSFYVIIVVNKDFLWSTSLHNFAAILTISGDATVVVLVVTLLLQFSYRWR